MRWLEAEKLALKEPHNIKHFHNTNVLHVVPLILHLKIALIWQKEKTYRYGTLRGEQQIDHKRSAPSIGCAGFLHIQLHQIQEQFVVTAIYL